MSSSLLNQWLGHEVIFKMEALQKIGAFKYRGVINTLLSMQEVGKLPKKVVTFSSGNHAQAVASVCKKLNIEATINMAKNASPLKQAATRSYGATVRIFPHRQITEATTYEDAKTAYLLHPYDNDTVIAGQGTACLEALQDMKSQPDAIFCTCGGGGWISGSYLATKAIYPHIPVYAGEPLQANDAARSYQSGKIQKYENTPDTIADGAASLSITARTFQYIKQLSGFYEISEQEIIYWTQWLSTLLKITIEPTSAVAMAATAKWLATRSEKTKVLVLISGGNIAPETHMKIWQHNHLINKPNQKF
jgi:threonine dehydratase